MITKDSIKSEIDKLQDQYLETLFRIIKAFEYIPDSSQNIMNSEQKQTQEQKQMQQEKNEWLAFIENTYGCLSDDPIERGDQGNYEIREVIH
ncbi:conserved hypothetical protein [Desulfamplus magnetovallimortis]|uniref:Uncharacterized protein n=1 Tax=Desulfamplus magnetovallimortis TaxID=1246637 RepID=A0A1W1HGN7_9BACT|nr:hypothetical protein [Desulfamplus magnetovallimortis]SLM31657.1 conserved hypothetical protein [Desulfamplus magnetovallimortis]